MHVHEQSDGPASASLAQMTLNMSHKRVHLKLNAVVAVLHHDADADLIFSQVPGHHPGRFTLALRRHFPQH